VNRIALARDARPPAADGMRPAFPRMGATLDLEGVPDGYGAMKDPDAIKVMIRPWPVKDNRI